MKLIRTGLVMAALTVSSVVGLSAPADACSINGRNCYFAVLCAEDFLGHGDPVLLAECLAG